MSNQRTSAGTAANSDTQSIVTTSADIEASPLLCDVESYKSVLELFRCKDEKRKDWLLSPFVIGDNVFTTDAHCMVWFDKKIIPTFSEYDIYEEKKIEGVIPTEINIEKVIPIDEIKKGIAKCPTEDGFDWVGEDVECKECKGEGTVVWEYNNHEKEDDCPVCDGDGLSRKKKQVPNGKKYIPNYALIKMEQCFISANIFETIVKSCEALNATSITLISQTGSGKGNLFKIGDVSLLVMPVLPPDSYENVAHNIA